MPGDRMRRVNEALREVRLALLEADVHFKVARDFVRRVRDRALSAEVAASLTPAQQVLKIVDEELVTTLGAEPGSSLFVGDCFSIDFAGARAIGMQALLMDPAGVYKGDPHPRGHPQRRTDRPLECVRAGH